MSGICIHYTWRLVLRWWARPHTAWTTSNNVPGPSHDAYYFYFGATASFTLAHVAVDSAFRHIKGSQPLLLTRRTNVAGCYCSCRWPCLLRCQQHRAGRTKHKQRWKNTGFEYRVQAYGIWQVYTRYIPLTGPGPEPAWHQRNIDRRSTYP